LTSYRGTEGEFLDRAQLPNFLKPGTEAGETLHGKRVEVKGRLFPASATIEVQKVQGR
jgi:hypothetical protein